MWRHHARVFEMVLSPIGAALGHDYKGGKVAGTDTPKWTGATPEERAAQRDAAMMLQLHRHGFHVQDAPAPTPPAGAGPDTS